MSVTNEVASLGADSHTPPEICSGCNENDSVSELNTSNRMLSAAESTDLEKDCCSAMKVWFMEAPLVVGSALSAAATTNGSNRRNMGAFFAANHCCTCAFHGFSFIKVPSWRGGRVFVSPLQIRTLN